MLWLRADIGSNTTIITDRTMCNRINVLAKNVDQKKQIASVKQLLYLIVNTAEVT
jgi:hypothetical protein